MISPSITSTIHDFFYACDEVSPAFFKCEKRFENHVRGIYFIDTSDQLPSIEQLEQINTSFIAPSYFKSNDTSRWSHYLIWVASDEKRRDAAFAVNRKVIEDNKDYARKLIVFESDFKDFICNGIEGGNDSGPAESIISVWGEILSKSGLSEIQSDIARAAVIRTIRTPDPKLDRKDPISTKSVAPDIRLTKHLASISIEQFGQRKIRGDFTFSRVNLIRGVNGAGKTSLLESLEHFFCGGTRRADGNAEVLNAAVTFIGGSNPIKYSPVSNAEYQARDLSWYGRNINQGNKLFEGFARYNFLDTDAAVRFAIDNHASELSKLLALVALGPEVSRTWARIGEFVSDIDRELRPLQRSVSMLEANLTSARQAIAALQAMSANTQALVSVIRTHPLSKGWELSSLDSSSLSPNWFENVVPLRSLVQRLNRLPEITMLKDIDTSLSQTQQDIVLLKEKSDITNSTKILIKEAQDRVADRENIFISLSRLYEYMQADFGVLVARMDELKRSDAASQIKSPDNVMLLVEVLKGIPNTSQTLSVCRKELDQELAFARSALAEALEKKRELAVNLNAFDSIRLQIRQLGKEYIEVHHELDNCPLCRTAMNAQTLLQRIEVAVNTDFKHDELEQTAARSESLTKQVLQLSDVLRAITEAVMFFSSLESVPITQVIAALEKAISDAVELKSQIEGVTADLMRLERSGFSKTEYDLCTQAIKAFAITLQCQTPTNSTEILALQDSLKKVLFDERLVLQKLESQQTTITSQIQAILIKNSLEIDPEYNLTTAFEHLNERINDLMGLRIDFTKLPIGTIPSEEENLRTFTSQAAVLIEMVDSLSSVLKDEESKAAERAVLLPQIEQDEKCLSKENVEVARLQGALDVLKDLQSNHSLDGGLSDFFSKNFTAIQKIFSRIHVPNELRLASDHSGALERICMDSSQRVSLGQVSTGQRAAFVLSVFSMLNLSLRNAPPIMLIDDPIAHVDDLNCLSYLDFIADVAESGKRQIFFATANEKLGNLFEKKLGYLGDKLRVIDMRRDNECF